MKKLTVWLVLVMVVFAANSASAKLGRTFNEAGFTLGGYGNAEDLMGGYSMLEANHWQEQTNASRNWSFFGGLAMYEPGDVNKYKWEKTKIFWQPGLYQSLNWDKNLHLLLKPRLGYFFDRGTQKDKGFAYGGISEIIKTFNAFNKIGLTFDSMFESRKKWERWLYCYSSLL